MPAGQQTATNHDGQDSEQALLSCFGVSWVGFFKLTAGPVATPPPLESGSTLPVCVRVPLFCGTFHVNRRMCWNKDMRSDTRPGFWPQQCVTWGNTEDVSKPSLPLLWSWGF